MQTIAQTFVFVKIFLCAVSADNSVHKVYIFALEVIQNVVLLSLENQTLNF